jgi:hypothetical protein
MLGGFVLMATLMMTVMNPPATSSEAEGVPAPGNVIVEAERADKVDADVDLWVQAPGDRPVGYSNKSGRIFNLLRDDLGRAQDITDYNTRSRTREGRRGVNTSSTSTCTAAGASPIRSSSRSSPV